MKLLNKNEVLVKFVEKRINIVLNAGTPPAARTTVIKGTL